MNFDFYNVVFVPIKDEKSLALESYMADLRNNIANLIALSRQLVATVRASQGQVNEANDRANQAGARADAAEAKVADLQHQLDEANNSSSGSLPASEVDAIDSDVQSAIQEAQDALGMSGNETPVDVVPVTNEK